MNGTKHALCIRFDSCREECEKRIRRTVESIASEIVGHTPVATGYARGNWKLALDNIGTATCSDTVDPCGDRTIAAMDEELASFQMGQRIYIFNSVPYIFMLEYGYSQQSPDGILVVIEREISKRIDGGEL